MNIDLGLMVRTLLADHRERVIHILLAFEVDEFQDWDRVDIQSELTCKRPDIFLIQ
jgi:hypothetical protein